MLIAGHPRHQNRSPLRSPDQFTAVGYVISVRVSELDQLMSRERRTNSEISAGLPARAWQTRVSGVEQWHR